VRDIAAHGPRLDLTNDRERRREHISGTEQLQRHPAGERRLLEHDAFDHEEVEGAAGVGGERGGEVVVACAEMTGAVGARSASSRSSAGMTAAISGSVATRLAMAGHAARGGACRSVRRPLEATIAAPYGSMAGGPPMPPTDRPTATSRARGSSGAA
jgi:hypothetical protein